MKIQYTRHYRTKINERYKKRSTSYKGYHNTNLIKKKLTEHAKLVCG